MFAFHTYTRTYLCIHTYCIHTALMRLTPLLLAERIQLVAKR